MNSSVERLTISDDGMRWLRLVVGGASALLCAVSIGISLARIRVHVAEPVEALPLIMGSLMIMAVSVGAIIPAVLAHTVTASHFGIELKWKGRAIFVPWFQVSACRTLITDPLVGFRACGFDVWIDGCVERVIFLPNARYDEWLDYFRSTDDEDVESEAEEDERPIITC